MMTTPNPSPPLPVVDDVDTGGFWQAAAQGRVVVCACRSCAAVLHLPKAYCHFCGSWDIEWREVAPTGTLHSWTVVRQDLHPAFPAPYTTVLVDLDDAPGARLVGHLKGVPELTMGMPMRARFDEAEPGVVVVNWEPDPDQLRSTSHTALR